MERREREIKTRNGWKGWREGRNARIEGTECGEWFIGERNG